MLSPDLPTVEDVMARLATGDVEAYGDLAALATGPIRRMVLGELQSKSIWLDADRLDDIVGDAVLELARVAHAWRPDGGARPWHWARLRILSLAYAAIGQFTDELDDQHDELSEGPAPLPAADVLESLAALASRHDRVDLLRQALVAVTSERDRRVWLEVLDEESAGNRSAAVTVGAQNGLSSTNVRKICQRVRERLRRLAEEDASFAALGAAPAIAA